VASEGSVEQTRDLTNRNRIRGIPGRTSGQLIAKSISIKARTVDPAGVRGRRSDLPGEACTVVPGLELGNLQGDSTAVQESAEGIVGRAVGEASEALQDRKAE
jgi:hypothetical protein